MRVYAADTCEWKRNFEDQDLDSTAEKLLSHEDHLGFKWIRENELVVRKSDNRLFKVTMSGLGRRFAYRLYAKKEGEKKREFVGGVFENPEAFWKHWYRPANLQTVSVPLRDLIVFIEKNSREEERLVAA